jgi:hypothetical protein
VAEIYSQGRSCAATQNERALERAGNLRKHIGTLLRPGMR